MELGEEWEKHCNYSHPIERNYVAKIPPLKLEDVTIGPRIGSTSAHGLVYRGKAGDTPVAVKFTPALTSRDDPEKEMNLAQMLGDKARQNLDLPFPVVYGTGTVFMKLPKSYNNTENAMKENLRRDILQKGFKKSAAMRAVHQGIIPDGYIVPDKVKMWYIISELAIGDLNQIKNRTQYYEESKCALEKLHDMGYAHGDVHLGNFMLLKGNKVVIHDFDASVPATKETIMEDRERFVYAWSFAMPFTDKTNVNK